VLLMFMFMFMFTHFFCLHFCFSLVFIALLFLKRLNLLILGCPRYCYFVAKKVIVLILIHVIQVSLKIINNKKSNAIQSKYILWMQWLICGIGMSGQQIKSYYAIILTLNIVHPSAYLYTQVLYCIVLYLFLPSIFRTCDTINIIQF
jgi:hypothetical protein